MEVSQKVLPLKIEIVEILHNNLEVASCELWIVNY
jgi:hypothetical protein